MSVSFCKELALQLRTMDTFGAWDNKSDEDLLHLKIIKTKEQLKLIPIVGNVDEAQKQTVRMWFTALQMAFNRATGVDATVMFEMHIEGFGRGVVIAEGGYVVYDKIIKDAHRWGFADMEKLESEGQKALEALRARWSRFQPQS